MEPSPKRTCLDLETPSTPQSLPDSIEDPPPLPEPRFAHFKILYDQTWDYKKICADTFMADQQYLCVLEHVNKPNTHVHFQGMTLLAEPTLKNRITRLVSHHHLRKLNPKCRPSSMSCRPVDVVGFQYMCKEVKPEYVLAMNKFTLEELAELKEKSEMHVKEMQCCVPDEIKSWDREVIHKLTQGTQDVSAVIKRATLNLFKKETAGLLKLPKYNKHHTRTSIIRGLLENPHVPLPWKAELYSL